MQPQLKTLPTLFVQAVLVTAAAVLALVLITKFVAPIPLSINQTTTQKETAFNVTGKSSVTTAPDKAIITLGVSRKENDLKQAQTNANAVINNLQQKLGDLGVKKEDIKTQNYSIYPNFDYQKSGQNIIGYSVDITLNVSLTDFTKLNQVVDIATSVGINQVNGIDFTLSDEKENQVKSDARKQAIEDAKQNATELAGLSGMKLGRIINVSEGAANPEGPIMYADRAMGGGGGSPTNIQPGSTTYSYNVTLSYETL